MCRNLACVRYGTESVHCQVRKRAADRVATAMAMVPVTEGAMAAATDEKDCIKSGKYCILTRGDENGSVLVGKK